MVYAVLLKIIHTTHVTLTGVYKSVVNEIDHNRANLVHSACVSLIQRNRQRTRRKNAKPELPFLVPVYLRRREVVYSPSFLGHVVVTN